MLPPRLQWKSSVAPQLPRRSCRHLGGRGEAVLRRRRPIVKEEDHQEVLTPMPLKGDKVPVPSDEEVEAPAKSASAGESSSTGATGRDQGYGTTGKGRGWSDGATEVKVPTPLVEEVIGRS